jgi:hypothetical protein
LDGPLPKLCAAVALSRQDGHHSAVVLLKAALIQVSDYRLLGASGFVTRLIINKINKVQWVDFKLENVLVSLHSLKTMDLGSIIFKEWRVTWTFSYAYNNSFIFQKCNV